MKPPKRSERGVEDVARRAAFQVLDELRDGASWEVAWSNVRLPEGSLDRRFAVELAGGTMRLRARLDWFLSPNVNRALDDLEPQVLDLLRLGAYQILEARVASHAAVHASVELTKRRCPAASGLVNAVLRALLKNGPRALPERDADPVQYFVHALSHPEWMVRRWLERFGVAATEKLCEYNNTRPGFRLRVNRQRADVAKILQELSGASVSPWSPWSIRADSSRWSDIAPLLATGEVSVQDESGVLVGDACTAQAGETWMDLAAAPGGKTGFLAETLGAEGRVLAYDITDRKLDKIRGNMRRLGLANVEVNKLDARRISPQQVDGVLLDAPCTGLGVLARRPDARWRKAPEDLVRLPALQAELLHAATVHVKPGGLLLYSVCSFEPEETLAVVKRFQSQHPEFALERFAEDPALQKEAGLMYFLPQEHTMDGGFVARWRRASP